ncbi:MAG: hypothetical protein ACOX6U_02955 [Oscillospiraceae bacterium]
MKLRKSFIAAGLVLLSTLFFVTFMALNRHEMPEVVMLRPVKTVEASTLIAYYEDTLSPEIPKISVSVEWDGEIFHLPYDARLITDAEPVAEGMPCSWFMRLMNNFKSLPQLGDGYIHSSAPACFFIHFSEPPEGEVEIIDYRIAAPPHKDDGFAYPYGFVISYHDQQRGPDDWEYVGNHTRIFSVENAMLSFELWRLYEAGLLDAPYLRGLQIKCKYGEKLVEYDLLFRTNYFNNPLMSPRDSLIGHLTPLDNGTLTRYEYVPIFHLTYT